MCTVFFFFSFPLGKKTIPCRVEPTDGKRVRPNEIHRLHFVQIHSPNKNDYTPKHKRGSRFLRQRD